MARQMDDDTWQNLHLTTLLGSFRNRGIRLSADLRIKGQTVADAAHQQRKVKVLFAFFFLPELEGPDHANNDTVVGDFACEDL